MAAEKKSTFVYTIFMVISEDTYEISRKDQKWCEVSLSQVIKSVAGKARTQPGSEGAEDEEDTA